MAVHSLIDLRALPRLTVSVEPADPNRNHSCSEWARPVLAFGPSSERFRTYTKHIVKVYKLSFRKARRWRAEKFEDTLLQQIEEEDAELNEDLCAEQMVTSNGMDKI